MRSSTKYEVERVLQNYDADHDMGPDAPVTWREERLAQAIIELDQVVERLNKAVAELQGKIELHERLASLADEN